MTTLKNHWVMNNLKKSLALSTSIISTIFTIIPEDVFSSFKICSSFSRSKNILYVRIIICIIIILISFIINTLYLKYRKKVIIKGKNYIINIEYGNILERKNCKIVIPFDECFTTKIGNLPNEIKMDSICGQYLMKKPIHNIKKLAKNVELNPQKTKSRYKKSNCYTSGKIIPNGDDLLLAFAKLDENGLGVLSQEEYLNSLSILWKEINKYYCQKDVCIPILGSGITRINNSNFTQQELLDMIIYSYKLSSNKIKLPNKLYIICKKSNDFSLNDISKSY